MAVDEYHWYTDWKLWELAEVIVQLVLVCIPLYLGVKWLNEHPFPWQKGGTETQ